MTYPFSFNFTNSYICIILGRREHKKQYELLGYHRSGFRFRFCYKYHCVTLKVYHTPPQHQFFELWHNDIKSNDYRVHEAQKLHALCSVPSTCISMQMKCGWTEAFHMCTGKVHFIQDKIYVQALLPYLRQGIQGLWALVSS